MVTCCCCCRLILSAKYLECAKPVVVACRAFMVHLLPVLLLGLTDEAQGIRNTTMACLNQVGDRHKAIQSTSAAYQVLLLTPCHAGHSCLHQAVMQGPQCSLLSDLKRCTCHHHRSVNVIARRACLHAFITTLKHVLHADRGTVNMLQDLQQYFPFMSLVLSWTMSWTS